MIIRFCYIASRLLISLRNTSIQFTLSECYFLVFYSTFFYLLVQLVYRVGHPADTESYSVETGLHRSRVGLHGKIQKKG